MRTTLDIDDDVLAAAKDLAKAEGKTAGQVMSELARKALTTPSWELGGMAEQAAPFDYENGFPLLPYADGPPVTSALVRRLQDEIDLEDAIAWDHDLDAPRVFDSEPANPKDVGRKDAAAVRKRAKPSQSARRGRS